MKEYIVADGSLKTPNLEKQFISDWTDELKASLSRSKGKVVN